MTLRAVTSDEPAAPASFADQARAALERALADGAAAVLIVYGTETGVGYAAVPQMPFVLDGLVHGLMDQLCDNVND